MDVRHTHTHTYGGTHTRTRGHIQQNIQTHTHRQTYKRTRRIVYRPLIGDTKYWRRYCTGWLKTSTRHIHAVGSGLLCFGAESQKSV